MKINILNIMLILFFSLCGYGQVSISPIPVNGELNLNSLSSTIYLSNTTSVPLSLNLSISQVGMTKGIDRCSGKTLVKNQSCYLVISVNDSLLPLVENIGELKNNGVTLVNLKRTKIQSLGSSAFGSSSLILNDFLVQSFLIQNKTATAKSYSPVISGSDASKYEILINRCQNVGSGQSCSVSLKLKPQIEGSFSATITEPQVTGNVSISSSITSATAGVVVPLVESMSVSTASLDFGTLTSFSTSYAKTIVISNTGTLTISPIISVSSRMAIVLNRCSTVMAGESCSVSVAMKPLLIDSNGSMSESVSIKSSALASVNTILTSAQLNVPPAYVTGSSQGGSCASGFYFEGVNCVPLPALPESYLNGWGQGIPYWFNDGDWNSSSLNSSGGLQFLGTRPNMNMVMAHSAVYGDFTLKYKIEITSGSSPIIQLGVSHSPVDLSNTFSNYNYLYTQGFTNVKIVSGQVSASYMRLSPFGELILNSPIAIPLNEIYDVKIKRVGSQLSYQVTGNSFSYSGNAESFSGAIYPCIVFRANGSLNLIETTLMN